MQFINPKYLIKAVTDARKLNSLGKLPQDFKGITIAKFWNHETKQSTIKKRKLIQLAIKKAPRPKMRESELGLALVNYTRPASGCYDHQFTQKITALAPLWFLTMQEIANRKKQQLIKLAQAKKPRPNLKKHPLGQPLSSYTRAQSESYDKAFDQKIRSLAPQWFIDQSSINKNKLIQLAKSGEKRPKMKTDLGKAFHNFVKSGTEKGSYNYDFVQELKSLAPLWFISEADQKKNTLIALAKANAPKPKIDVHPLGVSLHIYTKPKRRTYDPVFTKEIKKIAPHWLINTADLRKNEIIQLAKSGQKRPSKQDRTSKTYYLSRLLHNYISRTSDCYDPIFTKKIKTLAPHWFRKSKKGKTK